MNKMFMLLSDTRLQSTVQCSTTHCSKISVLESMLYLMFSKYYETYYQTFLKENPCRAIEISSKLNELENREQDHNSKGI